jgi:hypothetical protein
MNAKQRAAHRTVGIECKRPPHIAIAGIIEDRSYPNRTTMPDPIVKSPYLKLGGDPTRGHCFRRREARHQTTKVPPLFGLGKRQADDGE